LANDSVVKRITNETEILQTIE